MIIAVDFDGTLCSGPYPAIGDPVPDAVKIMQMLHDDGHTLIIWTCRCGGLLIDAINWMLQNKIPFDRVNDHDPLNLEKYKSHARKVYAHVYIDDKNVGGLPPWSKIYQYISEQERLYRNIQIQ